MSEQIIINKTWGEHKQEQEIAQLKKDRMMKFFLCVFGLIVLMALLYSFWNWAYSNLGNLLYVVIGVIGVLILLLVFRKKFRRYKRDSSWIRIRHLPNWAYRKMKRKHSNIVNGEHYVYKKEGNRFYKKLK